MKPEHSNLINISQNGEDYELNFFHKFMSHNMNTQRDEESGSLVVVDNTKLVCEPVSSIVISKETAIKLISALSQYLEQV